MGWKRLSMWLKGGIVGVIIGIILVLALIIYSVIHIENNLLNIILGIPILPGLFMMILWSSLSLGGSTNILGGYTSNLQGLAGNLFFMLNIIFSYFLLGIIIGWIIGRFRKR